MMMMKVLFRVFSYQWLPGDDLSTGTLAKR